MEVITIEVRSKLHFCCIFSDIMIVEVALQPNYQLINFGALQHDCQIHVVRHTLQFMLERILQSSFLISWAHFSPSTTVSLISSRWFACYSETALDFVCWITSSCSDFVNCCIFCAISCCCSIIEIICSWGGLGWVDDLRLVEILWFCVLVGMGGPVSRHSSS